MKLINAIAKTAADLNLPKDQDHSAYRFHSDLFLSGLERIILVCRVLALSLGGLKYCCPRSPEKPQLHTTLLFTLSWHVTLLMRGRLDTNFLTLFQGLLDCRPPHWPRILRLGATRRHVRQHHLHRQNGVGRPPQYHPQRRSNL